MCKKYDSTQIVCGHSFVLRRKRKSFQTNCLIRCSIAHPLWLLSVLGGYCKEEQTPGLWGQFLDSDLVSEKKKKKKPKTQFCIQPWRGFVFYFPSNCVISKNWRNFPKITKLVELTLGKKNSPKFPKILSRKRQNLSEKQWF